VASPRRKLTAAVVDALAAVEVAPRDEAAAQLAIELAKRLDAGGDAERLAPPLLATLEALQLTPRARARLAKGAANERPPQSPLDEIRQRRLQRGG